MDARALLIQARREQRRSLDEFAAKRVLAGYGIPVPRSVVVSGAGDVAAACDGLDAPFAVKVMSPDILHKSDLGGVAVGLGTADDVRHAVEAMASSEAIRESRIDGYLIEEMAPAGQEVVVGGVRDPRFGPMIMVGLGGVFVEIMADVAFRICPITQDDARQMLGELRGAPLLSGARGGTPVSVDAIVDVLLRMGGADGLLLDLAGDVQETDINPLIVSEAGAVAVDARILLAPEKEGLAQARTNPAAPPRDAAAVLAEFTPLFEPRTVAVAGASASGGNLANAFIRRLKAFGFEGDIYPIHPSALQIEGLPAFASLVETPEPVDYAYVAVQAARVPEMLSMAGGRVRFAQVISSGFAEVPQGTELERKLIEAAGAGGCRLIGPNCLGVYSPRGRVTFPERASPDPGPIGIVSQSGGLATDMISRGQVRGLRFSGVITVGNSADLTSADMFEYFLADPGTRVIGMYLEDVKDGRRFFRLLGHARAAKPVVLLPGGRTRQGGRAAASHTGALAGDERVWKALAGQTGCVLADTLEQFLDVLLAFQLLTPRPDRPTERIVLFGNGGGSSVLATDIFARHGLDVVRFGEDTRAALEALELPPGTSIDNPIDAPVATLQIEDGRIAGKILEEAFATGGPDAVVMHLNLAAFTGRASEDVLDNLIGAALQVRDRYPGRAHFVLVLRSDEEPDTDAFKRHCRARALRAGIPVYDELSHAALPLAALRQFERYRRDRNGLA